MKHILTLTISSIFLVACGGGSGNGGSDILTPSLSDIAGTWDDSETVGEEVDKKYVVIKDYGELITYDYDGDSFDQGSDCYYRFTDSITDLGNGSFEIVDDSSFRYEVAIAVSNNQLTVTSVNGTSTSPSSSLTESDFIPLCNEISIDSRTFQDKTVNKKVVF